MANQLNGLPAGLSVNTASGLVSGTPETAGAFTVLLSATNTTGVGATNLLLTIADNAPAQWAGNGHWYQAVYAGPWTPVPPPYQTDSGVISANFTNTPPVGNQFFRLHKPLNQISNTQTGL